ncbi:MAG TPA: aldo/keto reductase [Polyangiaceae bacterium]|jgi:L-glyceraldehyde 3-phosphate reductase|nr:aldo/keto reductase [Polyangiaceae bacterium]
MLYRASATRYRDPSFYRRSGRWGLQLPALSLGLWHNFGGHDVFATARQTLLDAFDMGITHFDLANNYGPPYGAAEQTFGTVHRHDLKPYRDELIISTKAGYDMWPGPYGNGGSRKYLLASLDQSLKRMGLEYVDIFYSHRPDPDTPLEETCGALAHAVRVGKALYVGISNYDAAQTREASRILEQMGTPCLIHQPRYNLLDRKIEPELLATLGELGIGCITFSPLAQGLLTDRYLTDIPADTRAGKGSRFLRPEQITSELRHKLVLLNEHARQRGQSLAQMSLAWLLSRPGVTSTLVGASRSSQLVDSVAALNNMVFSPEELAHLDAIVRS